MTSNHEESNPCRIGISISAARQVLVEGIDETYLFQALGNHISMEAKDIQFQPYGGKSRLRDFLETLTALSDFSQVYSLAVVADADDSRRSAADRIRGALQNAGLSAPDEPLRLSADGQPYTAWLVIPHDSPGRALEDVCLDSVQEDPALACVDEFMECVMRVCSNPPKENEKSKSKIRAFLSSRERPDLLLGQAARAGIWNFDAPAFDPLKKLLRLL